MGTENTISLPERTAIAPKIPFWQRSTTFNMGFVFLVIVLVFTLFPGLFTSYSPSAQDPNVILSAPTAAHVFGTDNFGRDMFSRVLWGTRIDLEIGVLAVIIPLVIGSLIGLIAGYYGKWIDVLFMRLLDIVMAFPFTILVIAIVAIIGPGIRNLYIAIWLVGWKEYARLVRSEVIVLKESEYVQAAKTLGYSDTRILFKHVLPNVMNSAIVYSISDVMMCMLVGASMSFLGLGVQPPTPEWGALISDGRSLISSAWWICAFPGLALAITGIGISLLGDGLSDLLRTKEH
ncbi:ABC transporter permease [Desulfosporosinus sp. FKB]|uniref:ABC transporter permease n=1 Tax=Desulfosporosinus sp. FKB TaxID=1969835 RepID=UPI001FA85780|nr:ABC transporter permease [Desulfosporosinus sp. FKB]